METGTISIKNEQISHQDGRSGITSSQSILDTQERRFHCDLCDKSFKSNSGFKNHIDSHRDAKEHQCTICLKRFNRKDFLKTHVKIMHHIDYDDILPPPPPDSSFIYTCTLCSKELHPSQITNHKKFHPELIEIKNDTSLQNGNDKSKDSADLDNSVDDDEEEGESGGPTNVSKNNSSGGREFSYSLGRVIFRCSICNITRQSLEHIQNHLRTHSGEKPFVCSVDGCGKTFGDTSALRLHERVTHSEDRPFCCKYCGKSYKRRPHLDEHEITHEENAPSAFLCHLCEKAFKSRKNLTQHLRTHNKPDDLYKCDFCPKSFKNNQYYKIHLNKHHSKFSTSDNGVDYDPTYN